MQAICGSGEKQPFGENLNLPPADNNESPPDFGDPVENRVRWSATGAFVRCRAISSKDLVDRFPAEYGVGQIPMGFDAENGLAQQIAFDNCIVRPVPRHDAVKLPRRAPPIDPGARQLETILFTKTTVRA
jgi:hypothetical protein